MNIEFLLFRTFCGSYHHDSCIHPVNIGKTLVGMGCEEKVCPAANLAAAEYALTLIKKENSGEQRQTSS